MTAFGAATDPAYVLSPASAAQTARAAALPAAVALVLHGHPEQFEDYDRVMQDVIYTAEELAHWILTGKPAPAGAR